MKINAVYIGNIASIGDEICLSESFNLVGIISEKNKISSEMLTFSISRNLTLYDVVDKDELNKSIRLFDKSTIFIMCGFGIILTQDIVSTRKIFNIHPGELPKYKGRHPIFHSIINGENRIGITLHEVNERIDEGAIIDIIYLPLPFDEGEVFVFKNLRSISKKLLNSLNDFLLGNKILINNNSESYFPIVSEESITINVDMKPALILNIIRAQAKYNGGIFLYEGMKYGIKKAVVDFIKKDFHIKNNLIFDNENSWIGINIDSIIFIKVIESMLIPV